MTELSFAPKIRLLRCDTCHTLEELPDYQGPAEYDTLLEVLLSRHETNGERHIGRLIDVDQRAWELPNVRKEIIEQIKGGISPGLAAFDPTFYDTRNTFQTDALKCYKQHLRPSEGCQDYHDDSKILLPDTAAERRDVGLPKPARGNTPLQFLCSFCPVESYVQHQKLKRAGQA